jgi:hypothetical protein
VLDFPPALQNAVNNIDNNDAAADHNPFLRVLDSPPDLQNADTHLDNNDASADQDHLLRVLDFLLLYRMLLMIQITMMLLLIMILFFVCWTPLLLFNMLAAFDVIDPTLTQGTDSLITYFTLLVLKGTVL